MSMQLQIIRKIAFLGDRAGDRLLTIASGKWTADACRADF